MLKRFANACTRSSFTLISSDDVHQEEKGWLLMTVALHQSLGSLKVRGGGLSR